MERWEQGVERFSDLPVNDRDDTIRIVKYPLPGHGEYCLSGSEGLNVPYIKTFKGWIPYREFLMNRDENGSINKDADVQISNQSNITLPEFQIAKIDLQPGEKILFRFPQDTPPEAIHSSMVFLAKKFGEENVICVVGDVDITKVKVPDSKKINLYND